MSPSDNATKSTEPTLHGGRPELERTSDLTDAHPPRLEITEGVVVNPSAGPSNPSPSPSSGSDPSPNSFDDHRPLELRKGRSQLHDQAALCRRAVEHLARRDEADPHRVPL